MFTNRRTFMHSVIASAGSAVVLGLPARAQQVQQARKIKSFAATLVGTTGRTLFLNTVNGPLTMDVADNVDIWKGAHGQSLSVMSAGDDLFVATELDQNGRAQITRVWANIKNFYGEISEVRPGSLKIQLFNASGPTAQTVPVLVGQTAIVNSGKGSLKDLAVGRFVQVISVDLGNGNMRATRLFVYR